MSTVSTLMCPRCGNPLQACQDDAAMHRCATCDGALVAQSSLQPLLEKLAEDLRGEECLNDVILAIPDKGTQVNCPQCRLPMENYGYLSTDTVYIDGCLNCCVVWTDANELGVMAAIYARSMAGHDDIEQQRAGGDDQDSHFRALRRIRGSFRRMR